MNDTLSKGTVLESRGKYYEAYQKYKEAATSDSLNWEAWNKWKDLIFRRFENKDKIFNEFQEAVAKADTAFTYNLLGNLFLGIGKDKKAIVQYRKAINKETDHVWAHYNWGLALLNLEKFEKAVKQFKDGILVRPDYKDCYTSWAGIIGKLENPFVHLQELKTQAEQNHDAEFRDQILYKAFTSWGLVLEGQEKLEEAIGKFREAISIKPNEEHAYSLWANVIGRANSPGKQLEELKASLKKVSGNEFGGKIICQAYNGWGKVLEEKNEYEQAIDKYRVAIRTKADDEDAYTNWADSFTKSCPEKYIGGYVDELIKVSNKFASEELRKRILCKAYNAWGQRCMSQKKLDKAIEKFEQAVSYKRDFDEVYTNWGIVLKEQEKFDEAIEKFKQAASFNRTNDLTYENWGKLVVDNFTQARFDQYKEVIQRLDTEDACNRLGIVYSDMGEYSNAIQMFKKALAKDPKYVWAYRNWGIVLERQRLYEKAISKYVTANKLSRVYEAAFSEWGRNIPRVDEKQKNILSFRKAIKKSKRPYGDVALGNVFLELQEYDTAIVEYSAALQKRPSYDWALHCLGVTFERQGKYKEAIEKYKQVLAKNPEFTNSLAGWRYSVTKLPDNEVQVHIEEFQTWVKKNFDRPEGYCEIGYLYEALKKYDDAAAQYKIAIHLSEKYPDAYYALGNIYLSQVKYELAVDQFQRALSFKNDFAYALHNSAFTCGLLGQYKVSKKKWRETLQLYAQPSKETITANDFNIYHYSGTIYHNIFKDFDNAEFCYKVSLDVSRDNTDVLISLAKMYLEKRSYYNDANEKSRELKDQCQTQAWAAFQRIEKKLSEEIKDESKLESLLKLGQLYSAFDNHSKAIECIKKYNDKSKSNIESISELGSVHMKLGEYKEAVLSFEKAAALSPFNADLQAKLGKAYIKSGLFDKAEFTYRGSLDRNLFHMDSILGLGELYISLGDSLDEKKKPDQAEEQYSQAIFYLNQARSLFENCDFESSEASRLLGPEEKDELYYSLGYSQAKLYELQRNKDRTLLRNAEVVFSRINSGTPNYYKAARAIKKIGERRTDERRAKGSVGAWLIMIFSGLIFLLSQFAFFVGRPIFHQVIFSINEKGLEDFKKMNKLDSTAVASLNSIKHKKFESEQHGVNEFERIFGKKLPLVTDNVFERKQLWRFLGFESIDTVLYTSLTFGSLVFIIIGLYITDISKLKVGAIELEKTSGQPLTTSSPLGIGR